MTVVVVQRRTSASGRALSESAGRAVSRRRPRPRSRGQRPPSPVQESDVPFGPRQGGVERVLARSLPRRARAQRRRDLARGGELEAVQCCGGLRRARAGEPRSGWRPSGGRFSTPARSVVSGYAAMSSGTVSSSPAVCNSATGVSLKQRRSALSHSSSGSMTCPAGGGVPGRGRALAGSGNVCTPKRSIVPSWGSRAMRAPAGLLGQRAGAASGRRARRRAAGPVVRGARWGVQHPVHRAGRGLGEHPLARTGCRARLSPSVLTPARAGGPLPPARARAIRRRAMRRASSRCGGTGRPRGSRTRRAGPCSPRWAG